MNDSFAIVLNAYLFIMLLFIYVLNSRLFI